MRVMGDALGDGPFAQLHAAHEGSADPSAAAMPFDNKQRQNIAGWIGLDNPVLHRQGNLQRSCQILIGNHFKRANFGLRPLRFNIHILHRNGRTLHG
ncbi:hypothetical protein D3C71_1626350 [compost metagenome]